MSVPWLTTRIVLERGGWWEIHPDDMEHFLEHARAYVASEKVDPEAKERVREVWLKRQYRPAWQPFMPAKNKPPSRDENPFG